MAGKAWWRVAPSGKPPSFQRVSKTWRGTSGKGLHCASFGGFPNPRRWPQHALTLPGTHARIRSKCTFTIKGSQRTTFVSAKIKAKRFCATLLVKLRVPYGVPRFSRQQAPAPAAAGGPGPKAVSGLREHPPAQLRAGPGASSGDSESSLPAAEGVLGVEALREISW